MKFPIVLNMICQLITLLSNVCVNVQHKSRMTSVVFVFNASLNDAAPVSATLLSLRNDRKKTPSL